MKIIVDAMGGDNAPFEIVKGAFLAIDESDFEIVLIGKEGRIKLAMVENNLKSDRVTIVNADETIEMCDDPSVVVKSKKNSSMAIGLTMLANGDGDAFVTAGSTGALLVGSTLIVKRINGIKRAALSPILPTNTGKAMLIDCGANTENTPEFLQQFGMMGSIYMNKILNIKNPKVGLLNNGTENTKGTALHIAANELLRATPSINFVGNIEGRDVLTGTVDVIVSDGFTGNILLKSIEGTVSVVMNNIKEILTQNLISKICAKILKPSLKKFKDKMDYNKQGGAPLLGISKPVIKSHGSSTAIAIKNSIFQAAKFYRSNAIEEITKNV